MSAGPTEVVYCHCCGKTLKPIKGDWKTRKYHLTCLSVVHGEVTAKNLKSKIKNGQFPALASLTEEDMQEIREANANAVAMDVVNDIVHVNDG